MASNQPQGTGRFSNPYLRVADAPGTITSAPVLYNQNDARKREEEKNAALRFKPTKRPQQQKAKTKNKTTYPRATIPPTSSIATTSSSSPGQPAAAPARPTFADFTNNDDEDVNGFYTAGKKRPRGGKRKKKTWQQKEEEEQMEQNWDDIYDPAKPTVFRQYRDSEEKYRSTAEWKDRLYAHRKRRDSTDLSSEDDRGQPTNVRFAPPSNYNFAPPRSASSGSSPAPEGRLDLAAGDDTHAERMRNLQRPPSPEDELLNHAGIGTTQSKTTIIGAPVRYNIPAPSPEAASTAVGNEPGGPAATDATVGEGPRANRPGQKGFGARLMAKMGYVEGKGLGANEDGIITPLQAQREKRKKRSDAEGGGYRDRGGRGAIVGGKKAKTDADEEASYGPMSEVVVVWGMLDGVDLEEDNNRNDGGIRQEIGDWCRDKFGNLEKVQPHAQSNAEQIPVYLKFTTQMYAYMAVHKFNDPEYEGFHGNKLKARFYDLDKFEQGEYE